MSRETVTHLLSVILIFLPVEGSPLHVSGGYLNGFVQHMSQSSQLGMSGNAVDIEAVTDMAVEEHALPNGEVLRLRCCARLSHCSVVDDDHDRTGLFCWPGARAFCDTLQRLYQLESADDTPATMRLPDVCSGVFELGGGVGLGALTAAALWKSLTESWVTDVWETALDLAVSQLDLNKDVLASRAYYAAGHGISSDVAPSPRRSRVRVGRLDWLHFKRFEGDSQLIAPLTDNAQVAVTTSAPLSSWIDVAATSALPLSFAHILGRGVRKKWLVALDTVYPTTPDNVLVGFFNCVAFALRARLSNDEPSPVLPSLVDGCTLTFVERDVGVTLRRLLVAATCCGLSIVPLSSPFQNHRADVPTSVAKRVHSSYHAGGGGGGASDGDALWQSFAADVMECMHLGTLALNTCGTGAWILHITLIPNAVGAHVGGTQKRSAPTLADDGMVLLPQSNSDAPSVGVPLLAIAKSSSASRALVLSQDDSCIRSWLVYAPWLWPSLSFASDDEDYLKTLRDCLSYNHQTVTAFTAAQACRRVSTEGPSLPPHAVPYALDESLLRSLHAEQDQLSSVGDELMLMSGLLDD